MSSIHERPSEWFGIARRLPDGSITTPQSPALVSRISPSAGDREEFQRSLDAGEIQPLFPVKKKDGGGLCAPVSSNDGFMLGPEEIHR